MNIKYILYSNISVLIFQSLANPINQPYILFIHNNSPFVQFPITHNQPIPVSPPVVNPPSSNNIVTKENQTQLNNLNVESVYSSSGLSDKTNVSKEQVILTPENTSPEVTDDQNMNKETPQRTVDLGCSCLNKRQQSQADGDDGSSNDNDNAKGGVEGEQAVFKRPKPIEKEPSCTKKDSKEVDGYNKKVDPNYFKNINDNDLKLMAQLMNMQRRGKYFKTMCHTVLQCHLMNSDMLEIRNQQLLGFLNCQFKTEKMLKFVPTQNFLIEDKTQDIIDLLSQDNHPIFKFIRLNNNISKKRKCNQNDQFNQVSLILAQIEQQEIKQKYQDETDPHSSLILKPYIERSDLISQNDQ